MRRIGLLLLALAGSAGALRAEPDGVRAPPAPRSDKGGAQPAPARPNSLDDLFARLSAAGDEAEAKGIAGLIERRFARSGSDTADLLMSRAGDALAAKDAALTVELLDRVTQLRPDWAEAWSRRAAAFYLLDDPVGALADLNQALKREPRHYSAWAALGHIRLGNGDKRGALEAFRRALSIHPFLDGLTESVGRIAPEIDGRDL